MCFKATNTVRTLDFDVDLQGIFSEIIREDKRLSFAMPGRLSGETFRQAAQRSL